LWRKIGDNAQFAEPHAAGSTMRAVLL